MKKTFIILLTFNGSKFLPKTLEGLQSILYKKKEVKLLVVDNNSKDNSLELIKKTIRDFKVIPNKRNLGYAKGMNIGIKTALKSGADQILLINQDAFFDCNNFDLCIENSNFDIWSPVIKFKKGDFWLYDYGGVIDKKNGKCMHLLKRRQGYKQRKYQIDYVSGCSIFIKKAVFKKVGLFDERFFMYYEDVDFCLRAKKNGFSIAVCDKSEVLHKLTPIEERSFRVILQLIISRLFFILKWKNFENLIYAIFSWMSSSIKILFMNAVYKFKA